MTDPIFYCRGSRKEDTDEIIRVIESAFKKDNARGFPKALAHRLANYDENRVIIKKIGSHEEIVGSCPIFRYPFHFGMIDLQAGGIFYFGIERGHERQGLGQKLLEDCNRYLTSIGWDANFLYTGSPSFYRHKGYEMSVIAPEYVLPIQQIPASVHKSPDVQFDAFKAADIPKIAALYEAFNRHYPVTRVRTEAYWTQNFHQNPRRFEDQILTIRYHGDIVGYILTNRAPKKIQIIEYALEPNLSATIHAQIIDSLFHVLKKICQENQLDRIAVSLFSKFPLVGHIIKWRAYENSAYLSALMLTVFNLQALLPKIIEYHRQFILPKCIFDPAELQQTFPIVLQIEDQWLRYEWNNNQITITHTQAQPIAGLMSRYLLDIPRSIFGTLIFGNMTPSELVESEFWICPEKLLPVIDQLFPHLEGIIYPFDRF